ALALALLNAGWQMRRSVVKPLEAMGRAARRIAGGNLDFALPESRVKEIAAVRAAFQAMGDGLREAIGRQAALEEERRFFIGAIAHDLRTPLFTLRGSLVGLEQGLATSPEKAARYVAVCRQKADQLDRLVGDLFAYTRAEYLEQTLRRERLELGPLLEQAVDDLRLRARAKGVTVTSDGPDDGSALAGDAHLVGRAVENLLDNALRHTPTDGTIAVRWQTEADRVTFTVADTGPGIAARDLPHLFDPLYRGEASRNRETGGVGLGLTIARRILRAHGGDLTAANGATGGAEFTGWLPLSSPPAPLHRP
ncbi:MAG: sensor histidine kinase, partial [Thermomicrobiales bacterium]